MKLDTKTIESIASGIIEIEDNDGKLTLHRFSKWQRDVYYVCNKYYFKKSRSGAGVKLDFYTDSSSFSLDYEITSVSSRDFYFFDVYVDDILVLHRGEKPIWIKKGTVAFDIGNLSYLKTPEHRVTVWLPFNVCAEISNVTIDDGAGVRPVEYSRKMLSFGDSITHGFDVAHPSLSYLSRVTTHYNAYCVNQAMGGEKFAPHIIDENLDFDPDIVTVAYGTNDWSKLTADEFSKNCCAFLKKLGELYRGKILISILPVFRADYERITEVGKFQDACDFIRETALSNGFKVIEGWNLVPHTSDFFGDGRLHPNDLGMGSYAFGVIKQTEEMILKNGERK